MKNINDVLCVSVAYKVDEIEKVFHGRISPEFLIKRFLDLEMGKTQGLFIPVGNGMQVSAGCIIWFRIVRPNDNCDCPDQFIEYAL